MTTIDFNEYFDKLTKMNTNLTNMYDTIRELCIYPDIDIISYKNNINIVPNNVAYFNKDNDGNYFIEIELDRSCDIITNFELEADNDIHLSLNIHGTLEQINNKSKIILIAAMYTNLKLRFTFINSLCEIKLSYDAYLAQTKLRRKLTIEKFKTENVVYSDGMANIV